MKTIVAGLLALVGNKLTYVCCYMYRVQNISDVMLFYRL